MTTHRDIIQREDTDLDLCFPVHAIATDAQFEGTAESACRELTDKGAVCIEISGPMNCPLDFERIMVAWGWR